MRTNAELLHEVLRRLGRIERGLRISTHNQGAIMAVSVQNYNDLADRANKIATHTAGIELILTQLHTDLEEAKDDPEQIQAILDALDPSIARLAAAAANTPATPVVVPAPVVE